MWNAVRTIYNMFNVYMQNEYTYILAYKIYEIVTFC